MKSIFLVNTFSGKGHLDSYARLYTRALLELGYRVTLVAATDGGTSDYLARNNIDQSSFSFVSFSQPVAEGLDTSRSHLSAIQRARLVWKEERAIGVLRRLVVVPRRFARRLVPESARIGWRKLKQAASTRLAQIPAVRTLRQLLFPDAGRVLFISLIHHVQNAVSVLGNRRPDLVFFLYLDLMAEGPANITALDTVGGWPWAGIQFHPRLRESSEARIEQYFESSTARGGVFLVPNAVDIYAEAAPRLKFLLVPDVADLELAAELPLVAKQIQSRAAGRTIVLLVGTIAAYKGVMTLLDIVAKADPQRFFFALIGEVHWNSFGDDIGQLRTFYAQAPENVVVHDGYVADERDYNSLVAACDVIYAVYSGFNSSSNSLTKAAGLKRPILTAKDSLMGERVLAHGIGLAVASNDANEIIAGLERLRTSKDDDFRFNSYAGQHSLDELKSVMAEALPLWITGSRASDGV